MTADDEARRDEVSKEEFVRRMPEGESAGPGAPETDEPVQGRPGAGGHGPAGPGGGAMEGMAHEPSEETEGGGGEEAGPDRGGTAAGAIREGLAEAGRVAEEAFEDRKR